MATTQNEINRIIIFTTLLIGVISVFSIHSATFDIYNTEHLLSGIVIKQSLWFIAGFIMLFFISRTSYVKLLDLAYAAYIINLLLLAYVLFFGSEHYGAKRWVDLGFISIQPSELVKLTSIFAVAHYLGQKREDVGTVKIFIVSSIIMLPAFILIFLQPDLGTAIVLVPIFLSVIYICDGNRRCVLTSICLGLLAMPVFWHILKDYQKNRLLVFINPNIDPLGAGYTIIQSKIAIGSGGLAGKGWLNGTQSYLKFLPERHTDFIFSVIGEEWGFIGGMLVIFLYGILIALGIAIINDTKDICGKAIATGITTLITFQVIVNISMTLGLMPVVGLPLPMISYGGSNMMASMIGIGFLISVNRR